MKTKSRGMEPFCRRYKNHIPFIVKRKIDRSEFLAALAALYLTLVSEPLGATLEFRHKE